MQLAPEESEKSYTHGLISLAYFALRTASSWRGWRRRRRRRWWLAEGTFSSEFRVVTYSLRGSRRFASAYRGRNAHARFKSAACTVAVYRYLGQVRRCHRRGNRHTYGRRFLASPSLLSLHATLLLRLPTLFPSGRRRTSEEETRDQPSCRVPERSAASCCASAGLREKEPAGETRLTMRED